MSEEDIIQGTQEQNVGRELSPEAQRYSKKMNSEIEQEKDFLLEPNDDPDAPSDDYSSDSWEESDEWSDEWDEEDTDGFYDDEDEYFDEDEDDPYDEYE